MMMKIVCTSALALFLTSCSIMPGMQNPNLTQMSGNDCVRTPTFRPQLVSITPVTIVAQNKEHRTYRIAPADILNIVVWNHPEFTPKELFSTQTGATLSTQGAAGKEGYLVNQEGNIYFPLVGTVHVAESTVDEVRATLTMRLKRYLKNPELNVRVADFRSKKVYIFGEIMKPGFIPFTDQVLSITDAISMSGGFDPNAADPSHVYIIRAGLNLYRPKVYWLNAKTPESLLLAEHFILKPGDILYVSSAPATRW
ncbi:MAG TPA: polysaccharide biosynthesis/export family protein, partial [Gammaproteobacteria bacterium]|nr:polysaccharide biosynthesis/export family protein [Gammaproteobacteria bacterium]